MLGQQRVEVRYVSVIHVAPGARFVVSGEYDTKFHRVVYAGRAEGVEGAQVAVKLDKIDADGGLFLEPREELIVDLLAGL